MSAAPTGDHDAVTRTLEAGGFPPGQAQELATRIREEVSTRPPLTARQLEQLRVLLDPSGEEPGRGAA